jgi:hypothetical protein
MGARGLLWPEPFEPLHRDLTHYLRQPAPDSAIADAGRFALTKRSQLTSFSNTKPCRARYARNLAILLYRVAAAPG